MKKFLYENGLSLTLLVITVLTLVGNVLTGWYEFNNELNDYNRPAIAFGEYLVSGHCIEAVFENWESEFLQMGLFVWLTVFLRQKGSSESKDLEKEEEVDRKPSASRRGAPWPVKRGGWILWFYERSLSLALMFLFGLTFFIHAAGGAKHYNLEQELKGKAERLSTVEFMGTSEFWFQSLQNWQSEFLSVLTIVVLSIFLRHKGSPQSKPVDAPDDQTGES